jgi:hypothetical protein
MSSTQTDLPSLCHPSLTEAEFAVLLTQLQNVATRSLREGCETHSEPGNVGNNEFNDRVMKILVFCDVMPC